VVVNDAGVRRVRDGHAVFPILNWGDVIEIRAFKRDLWIVDDVRLAFRTREGWCEFSEEEGGFEALGQKMCEMFPGVPTDWFEEVLQPPFETRERILFRRDESCTAP
jgi:hypothetical protein